MNVENLVQASVLIPDVYAEKLIRFVEEAGGFIRMERNEVRQSEPTAEKAYSGQTLRELREKSGMSQKELADSLGVPQSHVSLYESGIRAVPQNKRVSLDRLFFEVDEGRTSCLREGSMSGAGEDSMSSVSCPAEVTFVSPRKLFFASPRVSEHTREGGNFKVNGILSATVGGAAYLINKLLVEKNPGYEELCGLIRESGRVEHVEPKVAAHLRNMAYYSTRKIATQWGVMEIVGVSSYAELPPCFTIVSGGQEITLRDDDSLRAMALLKTATMIRSPLLEKLSELARG
ncbi:MAG: helix-turn-helix transcriptional regulator [Mailhella sp.]|nr:helix-turn-helix transcriptional regulator [Mailhella sp.]